MEIGTAGLTAAASVKKLIDANVKNNLPILVSGATGGVGSVAVNILNKLNFEVHALTGKASENDVLTEMGAKEIIDRNNFMEAGIRPLDKAIYAGGIDTVGGDVLSKMLSMINNGGAVSCCGNVAGAKFTSSVFPFILRGVSLFGIDSAESDIELKKELWGLLSSDWFVSLSNQSSIVRLKDIEPEISKILEGKQIGRVVIKHGE
jgi:putative YhdH/YhfP family quinone oxidoreductase